MSEKEKHVDVLIIGGGAAGLTAAIYSARAGLDTVVCEASISGGKIVSVEAIENYPAFISIDGGELADKMKAQALHYGAGINEVSKVTAIDIKEDKKTVVTEDTVYTAEAIIIATGSSLIPLDVANEEKFRGKGIHYCATCDGAMYKNKTVIVTGGGNSAVSAAIYLSGLASKVIMVRRKDSFHCEGILLDRLKSIKNIQILYNWNIVDIMGENKFIGAILQNLKNNTSSVLRADAIFSFNGYRPDTELFKSFLKLDSDGYILTDENLSTSIPGVFAAGDVRSKKCRQITTAVSDGTLAACNAEKSINERIVI